MSVLEDAHDLDREIEWSPRSHANLAADAQIKPGTFSGRETEGDRARIP